MAKRGFSYYVAFVLQNYIVALPPMFLEFLGLRFCPFQLFNGIRIADPSPETFPYFTNAVAKALDLIAASDPVRFVRVQRNVRNIVNTTTTKYASCSGPPLKVCSVDFRNFYHHDFEMTVKSLAGALVYGTTFNYLIKRGILITKSNRQRVHAIPAKESARFLRLVGADDALFSSEQFGPEFRWPFLRAEAKEMLGILTRDAAAEAAVWKEQQDSVKKGDQFNNQP